MGCSSSFAAHSPHRLLRTGSKTRVVARIDTRANVQRGNSGSQHHHKHRTGSSGIRGAGGGGETKRKAPLSFLRPRQFIPDWAIDFVVRAIASCAVKVAVLFPDAVRKFLALERRVRFGQIFIKTIPLWFEIIILDELGNLWNGL